MSRKKRTEVKQRKPPIPKVDFWQAYQAFRRAFSLEQLNIQPEELLNNVRDRSPGREVDL